MMKLGGVGSTIAAFSTYTNINFSLKKQTSILKLVKRYCERMGVPPMEGNLVVPNDEIWPEEYRGKEVNLSRFRYLYRQNRLDPSVVEQMNALSFPWSVFHEKWKARVSALHTYLEIHGDLNVPKDFIVPAKAPWPPLAWHLDLGGLAMRLRYKDLPAHIPATDKAILQQHLQRQQVSGISTGNEPGSDNVPNQAKSIKVSFKPPPRKWHLYLRALKEYQANYGDSFVPISFVIPTKSSKWSTDLGGIRLGNVVNRIRTKRSKLAQQQIEDLDKINFVWNTYDFLQEQHFKTLKIYTLKYQHARVPQKFCVPQDESWPKEYHGLPLGVYVKQWRLDKNELDSAFIERLNELGFVWNMNSWRQSRLVKAVQTYHQLYGHARVPLDFVVDDDDEIWPMETRGMKLGNAIANLCNPQRDLSAWPAEQIAILKSLGVLVKH